MRRWQNASLRDAASSSRHYGDRLSNTPIKRIPKKCRRLTGPLLVNKSKCACGAQRSLHPTNCAHSGERMHLRGPLAMNSDVAGEEKSPVNLRIRTALKDKARNLGINLSQTLEQSLEDEIRRREQLEWVKANRDAIEAYNRRVSERGPALAAYRSF